MHCQRTSKRPMRDALFVVDFDVRDLDRVGEIAIRRSYPFEKFGSGERDDSFVGPIYEDDQDRSER